MKPDASVEDLKLNKETVKDLSGKDLDSVDGGLTVAYTHNCNTDTCITCTCITCFVCTFQQ